MSEKMKLHVDSTIAGALLVTEQEAVIGEIYCEDDAEYVCDAVNAYDPDAVNAYDPDAVPATLDLTSESQWIPAGDGAINPAHVSKWHGNTDSNGTPHVEIWYGDGDTDTLHADDALFFLRYMANAMGDAFPEALKEMLA
jgi:hypothetical protein